MTRTAMSSLESAREKFFMNWTYIMSRKYESKVFALRRPKESNTHELARIGKKKIFHELDAHHV